MKTTVVGLTDVGKQRDHNEDSFSVLPEFGLYLVADGMGGHRAGDVASSMAAHSISSFFNATMSEDSTWPFHFDPKLSVAENRLLSGIKMANKKIFEASSRHREVQGMGTTVVAMLFVEDSSRAYVAHVGDSRCYRLRDGEFVQLTRDHSLVNDYLMVMPDMSAAQRDELPKNVITRALGMQETVMVDMTTEEPGAGDQYLLCSDGLSGMVEDERIAELMELNNSPEAVVRSLVDEANAAGGEDNVTVVLARVSA